MNFLFEPGDGSFEYAGFFQVGKEGGAAGEEPGDGFAPGKAVALDCLPGQGVAAEGEGQEVIAGDIPDQPAEYLQEAAGVFFRRSGLRPGLCRLGTHAAA